MRQLLKTAIALAAAGLVWSCEEKSPSAPASKPLTPVPPANQLRIAVVPKGTTHDFWKSIHAGAVKAAQELGGSGSNIQVTFRGPEKEDDREQQVALVQNLISGKYDAIVLAPLDDKGAGCTCEAGDRGQDPGHHHRFGPGCSGWQGLCVLHRDGQ
jgi:ABC-type sugar transport system substrate-binding protein